MVPCHVPLALRVLTTGNHDVENNVLNCFDWGVDATTCTRRSMQVLRQTVTGKDAPGRAIMRWVTRQQVEHSCMEDWAVRALLEGVFTDFIDMTSALRGIGPQRHY
jgi:hypothetical protein